MQEIVIKNYKELPSGHNITQNAGLSPIENGIEYEVLSDNPIEYIDWLNLSKAITILSEFFDVHACAISNENMLQAVGLGASLEIALQKCLDSNPLIFNNSTLAFTKNINLELAKQLTTLNIRNVISTKFDKEATEYLINKNINVVLLKSPLQELLGLHPQEVQATPFGYLVQNHNDSKLTKSSFKVTTKTKPTQQQAEDAIFAWKIAKYTNTKSIVIVKNLTTIAIVQNQISEIEGIEKAIDIACENSKDAVLGLDSTIENEVCLNAIIQGRIGLVIEAGNSLISDKIIKLADKYNLSLIHTGIRNYKY